MTAAQQVLRTISDYKLIVILRGMPLATVERVASSLLDAGVKVVEIAMNSEHALEQIEILKRLGLCVGAGTAVTDKIALSAIRAGAEFLLSPVYSDFFLPLCQEHNVLAIPGGATPTEIHRLHREGAQLIKFFPAAVGGAECVRHLLAPFRDLKLVPTGGVTLAQVPAFLRAGSAALAVGGEIASSRVAAAQDFATIKARATQFVAAIKGLPQSKTNDRETTWST